MSGTGVRSLPPSMPTLQLERLQIIREALLQRRHGGLQSTTNTADRFSSTQFLPGHPTDGPCASELGDNENSIGERAPTDDGRLARRAADATSLRFTSLLLLEPQEEHYHPRHCLRDRSAMVQRPICRGRCHIAAASPPERSPYIYHSSNHRILVSDTDVQVSQNILPRGQHAPEF